MASNAIVSQTFAHLQKGLTLLDNYHIFGLELGDGHDEIILIDKKANQLTTKKKSELCFYDTWCFGNYTDSKDKVAKFIQNFVTENIHKFEIENLDRYTKILSGLQKRFSKATKNDQANNYMSAALNLISLKKAPPVLQQSPVQVDSVDIAKHPMNSQHLVDKSLSRIPVLLPPMEIPQPQATPPFRPSPQISRPKSTVSSSASDRVHVPIISPSNDHIPFECLGADHLRSHLQSLHTNTQFSKFLSWLIRRSKKIINSYKCIIKNNNPLSFVTLSQLKAAQQYKRDLEQILLLVTEEELDEPQQHRVRFGIQLAARNFEPLIDPNWTESNADVRLSEWRNRLVRYLSDTYPINESQALDIFKALCEEATEYYDDSDLRCGKNLQIAYYFHAYPDRIASKIAALTEGQQVRPNPGKRHRRMNLQIDSDHYPQPLRGTPSPIHFDLDAEFVDDDMDVWSFEFALEKSPTPPVFHGSNLDPTSV